MAEPILVPGLPVLWSVFLAYFIYGTPFGVLSAWKPRRFWQVWVILATLTAVVLLAASVISDRPGYTPLTVSPLTVTFAEILGFMAGYGVGRATYSHYLQTPVRS